MNTITIGDQQFVSEFISGNEEMIRRMSTVNPSQDAEALAEEGVQFASVTPLNSDGFRLELEAFDVAYLNSCGRAVMVSNADPVWFDANSLSHAIERILNNEEIY